MDRLNIINSLIERYDYKSYLEIGVRNPDDCFNWINCDLKHGVDPGYEGNFPVTFRMTSDEFFATNPQKYDLIFIDGSHIDDQVERDILNSLNYLNEGGTIVMHDCSPPTPYHARENYSDRSTLAGGYWNGTTWKAFVKVRSEVEGLYSCVVDCDWGVGIIQRSETTNMITNDNLFYAFDKFTKNRKHYLNLISPQDFLDRYIDNQPKITFVIPSINRPSLIDSVNSLLNQTNPNWKCIIVYDGVDGLKFNDPRIKTVKIEKKGVIGENNGQAGLVRNSGLRLVNSEWIGFLDDDDKIHPDYVKTLFEKYTDYDVVVWRMQYENGLILPNFDATELIGGEVGISFCYKNKFDNLYFDGNFDGEDYLFIIKLSELTKNFALTPEVYYYVGKNTNIPKI